jgi:hypothetical protein
VKNKIVKKSSFRDMIDDGVRRKEGSIKELRARRISEKARRDKPYEGGKFKGRYSE